MKKLLLLSFALVFALLQQAAAQSRTVTGTVTDQATGQGLPGVAVLVKGAGTGTATAGDGSYSINVPGESSTLVFRFLGYTTVERAVGTSSTINVSLEINQRQLDEVVVVGYGAQAKKDVVGAISTVSGEQLANLPAPSFDRALAGRAAGVQVITPSGLLGQAPQIRIRGINSISSGTSPLIVIDGVPSVSGNTGGFTSANALADINPNDIESMEILKDGAATAIYGSRASNGVILITTKRGKQGKTQFNYDVWGASATVSKRFDLLNANEFIEIANERFRNAKQPAQAFPTPDGNGGFMDTDWQDHVFRRSLQQSHNISASGATEGGKYFVSLGFADQQGAIVANALKRYSLRANLDQDINKFLSFGLTSGLTYQNNEGPLAGSNNLSGNIFGATRMLPNVPVLNPGDPTGYNIEPNDRRVLGRGGNNIPISDNIPNILFVLDNNKRVAQTYRILGSTFLEAKIVDGLKFRTQLGIDGSYADDFVYGDPRHGDSFSANGSMSQAYSPFMRWNWQNILGYNKVFNETHTLDVTLVSELQQQKSSFFQANVVNLSDRFFDQNIVSGSFVTPTIGGGLVRNGIESYLGRFSYNYKSKYYLTGSIRRDALSSLPVENRVGYFPGVGASWRVSEEDFFANSGINFISDLRLRASFAEVGNTDIGSFPYMGTYGAAAYGNQPGIGFNNTGNPLLRWESQKKYDAGINLGLLQNRIMLNASYWVNDNSDIILAAPTPPSLGIPGNSINRNIGSVRNQGLEFELNATVVDNSAFSWNTALNFSTQKNEVRALVDGQDITGAYNITRVGESIRSIYGYVYRGVNMANGNPLYEKADGSIIQGRIDNQTYYVYDPSNPNYFFDATKPVSAENPDNRSSLAGADRRILGNSLPKWFGGFNNTVTYGNFDLNVFLRFQGGNHIMNRTRQDLLNMNFVNNSTEILGRWQSADAPGDGQTPRLFASRGNFINLENSSSTRFVEKGDFLRLDNLALGYNVPTELTGKIGLSRLRVYASGQNLMVLTGYSGLDPETNTTGAGVDYNGNPQVRTFTFGVNVGF
jgi:TonB-dependent starch-binding outer membrane protein SusC